MSDNDNVHPINRPPLEFAQLAELADSVRIVASVVESLRRHPDIEGDMEDACDDFLHETARFLIAHAAREIPANPSVDYEPEPLVRCADPSCGVCSGYGEFPTGSGYTRAWVPHLVPRNPSSPALDVP